MAPAAFIPSSRRFRISDPTCIGGTIRRPVGLCPAPHASVCLPPTLCPAGRLHFFVLRSRPPGILNGPEHLETLRGLATRRRGVARTVCPTPSCASVSACGDVAVFDPACRRCSIVCRCASRAARFRQLRHGTVTNAWRDPKRAAPAASGRTTGCASAARGKLLQSPWRAFTRTDFF